VQDEPLPPACGLEIASLQLERTLEIVWRGVVWELSGQPLDALAIVRDLCDAALARGGEQRFKDAAPDEDALAAELARRDVAARAKELMSASAGTADAVVQAVWSFLGAALGSPHVHGLQWQKA